MTIINTFDNIKLIKPNVGLKREYLNMITEWKECGEELIPWSLIGILAVYVLAVRISM